MAPLHSPVLLALFVTSAVAQDQITWGSVLFTYHGEKIPILARGGHNLTPLGATQLFDAGSVIRDRYIAKPKNESKITEFLPINGISQKGIDNTQLDVMTLDDEYQSASAMAFMQGLYPPRGSLDMPDLSEEGMYAPGLNGVGSLIVAPLDGYQYPHIRTMGELDRSYVWIAGNIGCDNYDIAEMEAKNSTSYTNRIDSTLSFYSSMYASVFNDFQSTSVLDYSYASQLYEYALYEWSHNTTIYDDGNFTTDNMATLYSLASEQQFFLNSVNTEYPIVAVSGRTLASKVLQQFNHLIVSNGSSDKLTLMFTSFEPMLSFFSLSQLSTGPANSRFQSLPLHGSIMGFELFSYGANEHQDFPDTSDLFVRFIFRNGTNSDNSTIIAYPLFGRGNSETDMSWSDFVDGMSDFSLDDVSEWCNVCQTQNLFCEDISRNINSSSGSDDIVFSAGSRAVSPAVAGVIGAAVTLAVAIVAAALLGFFGFRFKRHEKDPERRKSDLGVLRTISGGHAGGFKGAEKLASDTDLRLKGGAGATVVRHERVGSWELNDGPSSQHNSLDKDLESGRITSGTTYGSGRRSEDHGNDDHVNPFGDPVKANDQI